MALGARNDWLSNDHGSDTHHQSVTEPDRQTDRQTMLLICQSATHIFQLNGRQLDWVIYSYFQANFNTEEKEIMNIIIIC